MEGKKDELGWIYAKAEESILFQIQQYLRAYDREEQCVCFRLSDLLLEDESVLGVQLGRNKIQAIQGEIPRLLLNIAVHKKPDNKRKMELLCHKQGYRVLNPVNEIKQKYVQRTLQGIPGAAEYLPEEMDWTKKDKMAWVQYDACPVEIVVYINKVGENQWEPAGIYVENHFFGEDTIWSNRILELEEGLFRCSPGVEAGALDKLRKAAVIICKSMEMFLKNRCEFVLHFTLDKAGNPYLLSIDAVCEKLYRMPAQLRKTCVKNRMDYLLHIL